MNEWTSERVQKGETSVTSNLPKVGAQPWACSWIIQPTSLTVGTVKHTESHEAISHLDKFSFQWLFASLEEGLLSLRSLWGQINGLFRVWNRPPMGFQLLFYRSRDHPAWSTFTFCNGPTNNIITISLDTRGHLAVVNLKYGLSHAR